MSRDKLVDLNTVLMGANLLVAGAQGLVFNQLVDNSYVDRTSLLLGLLLCAQTQLMLWHERRHHDPFVILLAAEMIAYYALRLCTLTLYPFSLVFDRYAYGPADSNRALVFILIANLFLYAGLYLAKSKSQLSVQHCEWKATSPLRTILLLAAAIVTGYSSIHYSVEDQTSNLVGVLSLFFEPRIIIMMALAYFFLFRASLSRSFVVTIATLMILEMAVHTLAGSRSALVGFAESCVLVILAVAGRMQFRPRYLVLGAIFSPLIMVALLGSFAISTYNRAHREGASFDLRQALATAGESDVDLLESADLVLPPMFARAGFFDFSSEIIAHRNEYASVLNVGAYGRSIVDNLLTPGFDVYDQPRTANALQFIYRDLGEPSKEAATESYQSDQLGLYGELYGLFAYGSLPLFFLIAYVLKRIFMQLEAVNPFTLVMKRVVVLFVFVDLLHSFGIDWLLIDMVSLVVSIFIYTPFFAARPVDAARESPPPQSGTGIAHA